MSSFFLVSFLSLSFLLLSSIGYGESEAVVAPAPLPSAESSYPQKIIRKELLDDGSIALSTPLAVYENDQGRGVYLVGAVHIGENEYYQELNKRFADYDAVLFEMVGGEKLQRLLELKKKKTGHINEEEKKELGEINAYMQKEREKDNGFMKLLAGQYGKIASLLGVSSQKDKIDYSQSHFVHADMTREEMENAQKEKGETMFGLMFVGVLKSLTTLERAPAPDMMTFIRALKKEDKGTLKKIFIDMIANQVDRDTLGGSVLLEGRNDKCLSVFDKLLSEKPELKKVGIFYGAAHLIDLHPKLEKRGYKLRTVEWIPAWKVTPENAGSEEKSKPAPKSIPVKLLELAKPVGAKQV